jgi:hypothetical protein
MIVRVMRCWTGGDFTVFSLRIPDPKAGICTERIRCYGDGEWTRSKASEALDLLERLYGVKRSSVRFKHLN